MDPTLTPQQQHFLILLMNCNHQEFKISLEEVNQA